MRKIIRNSTYLTVSTLALVIGAAPAFAAGEPASDTADIIVTAQKRPEKLQEIPVAASVLSSDAVVQQHVTDLSDINRVVPSVEIKGTFNGRVPYGIRGISTNANEGAIGLTSGVSIQVDGVPVPADSFAANTVADVAQLEVLKGPQATLGGRTASAGVINFVTFAPTDTLKGAVTANGTDDGEYRFDARISGPIANGVSFSLAGFFGHTPYPVENLTRKEKSAAENWGVRGKLKFELTPDFDATLTGHYALAKAHGENFVPTYFTPGATVFPFIPYTFSNLGVPTSFGIPQSLAFPGYTIAYGNTQYASPVDMNARYEDKDGSVALNWRLGGLTVSSLTSYFHEKQFQSQDTFEANVYFFDVLTHGAAPHYGNIQTADGFVKQFTQELKVATDPDKPLNFIGGLYYSDMKVDQVGSRVWVANAIAKENISTTKNVSVYGRLTNRFSDQFSVIAGLRWNHDRIGWKLDEYFNPPAGQFYNCNPNFDAVAGTGVPTGCSFDFSDSSNSLVGDIALQYRPNRDTMVYGSYTRGYKPRAFNTVHDFMSFQTGPIYLPSQAALTAAQVTAAKNAYAADQAFHTPTKRENIDSFEIGLKSTLLDRHLTVNVAAFYTKYSDYQAQIFDNSKVVGVLLLANAGARTAGVEADLNYVRGNTRASLSAAYIDAKFLNFPNGTCYPTQAVGTGAGQCNVTATNTAGSQNLSGASLPSSPKFKASASITQTVPFEHFNLLVGGNLNYRSGTFMQANQNPQTYQKGFALLDLSLGVQTKDERASLTLFVNNVTNHMYYTNMEDFFSGAMGTATLTSFAPANYVIGQPARDSHRYFGGRVSVSF